MVVSVVVPIYGVEEYLRKCVDSIINQTYSQLEIILVDDGSPDNCPQICDDYAKQDKRVKVIHKKNGGLSDARNAGINVATGEWVALIDSDDFVADNFIESLLSLAQASGAEIACCGVEKVYEGADASLGEQASVYTGVLSNIEALRDLFCINSMCQIVACNKLYKTSLFKENSIEYPTGKIHEDNFTTYKLFACSDKVVYTTDSLYSYLQRDDSIMGRRFDSRRMDVLEAWREAVVFLESRNISIDHEIQSFRVLTAVGLLVACVKLNGVNDTHVEELRVALADINGVIGNKLLPLKHRLICVAARNGTVFKFAIRFI